MYSISCSTVWRYTFGVIMSGSQYTRGEISTDTTAETEIQPDSLSMLLTRDWYL